MHGTWPQSRTELGSNAASLLASCCTPGQRPCPCSSVFSCSIEVGPGLRRKQKRLEDLHRATSMQGISCTKAELGAIGGRRGNAGISTKTTMAGGPPGGGTADQGSGHRLGLEPWRTQPLPGCHLSEEEGGETPVLLPFQSPAIVPWADLMPYLLM